MRLPTNKEQRWRFQEFKPVSAKRNGFTLLEFYLKRPKKVKRNLRKLRNAIFEDLRIALLGIIIHPNGVLIHAGYKSWMISKNNRNGKFKSSNSKATTKLKR